VQNFQILAIVNVCAALLLAAGLLTLINRSKSKVLWVALLAAILIALGSVPSTMPSVFFPINQDSWLSVFLTYGFPTALVLLALALHQYARGPDSSVNMAASAVRAAPMFSTFSVAALSAIAGLISGGFGAYMMLKQPALSASQLQVVQPAALPTKQDIYVPPVAKGTEPPNYKEIIADVKKEFASPNFGRRAYLPVLAPFEAFKAKDTEFLNAYARAYRNDNFQMQAAGTRRPSIEGNALNQSERILRYALTLDPTDVESRSDLAFTLFAAGKDTEAAKELKRIAQSGRLSIWYHWLVGSMAHELDPEAGVPAMKRALLEGEQSKNVKLRLSAFEALSRMATPNNAKEVSVFLNSQLTSPIHSTIENAFLAELLLYNGDAQRAKALLDAVPESERFPYLNSILGASEIAVLAEQLDVAGSKPLALNGAQQAQVKSAVERADAMGPGTTLSDLLVRKPTSAALALLPLAGIYSIDGSVSLLMTAVRSGQQATAIKLWSMKSAQMPRAEEMDEILHMAWDFMPELLELMVKDQRPSENHLEFAKGQASACTAEQCKRNVALYKKLGFL
jgi:hypothetical protein